MKRLTQWIGAALFAVSTGAWAQQATFAGGILTIPAIRVGAATYLNVELVLTNPSSYTFRLTAATEQIPAGAAANVFRPATGLVSLPAVAVGTAVYTNVVLRLTDPATYTFVLAAATSPGVATFTIGGAVSGLSGTGLVLQNNGGDDVAVGANGDFEFANALVNGATYAVTVRAHPSSQRCTVSNGSGIVAQANVANVAVTCAATIFVSGTAKMATTRLVFAAALLASGQILVTGGVVDSSMVALDSAELYDPVTSTFTLLGARMNSQRNQHTATRLPDGKVLIAGGSNNGEGDGMDTAELYDPITRVFTPLAARMTTPRGGHTATLLANGKVLLAGGFFNSSVPHNSAELYDPATRTFAPLAATMAARREGHVASVLLDGKVLIAGGQSSHVALASAELYDPATQTFTAVGSLMNAARLIAAAALLPNGQVLITGGGTASTTNFGALDSAEVYDPAARTFSVLAARMSTPRGGHTATSLSNGAVLIAGGATASSGQMLPLDTVETYGP